MKRRGETVQYFLAAFLFHKHTFRGILVAFSADDLGIEHLAVFFEETVGNLIGCLFREFQQVVQYVKVQHDVVVRKALSLPYPIQRVRVEQIAVNG